MLNAQAIGELLSKNSDDRLCRRWFLMTPNGTLLANSQTVDTAGLRKQVARAAMRWQEYQASQPATEVESSNGLGQQSKIRTLIIESETSNILIRLVQPQLLLVLEGGVPPRKSTFEPRITAEDENGEALHRTAGIDSSLSTSLSSKAESTISVVSSGVVSLHRRKMEAMASAIASEFERTGFKMPNQSTNSFF